MKKWGPLLTIMILSLTMLSPFKASAAVNSQDLNQYIQQMGLSQAELANYLSDYGLSLNDFNSVADLKSYLGQPLNAQTLPKVLNDFGINQTQLNQILAQNGMSLNDYTFVNEIKSDLALFTTKANVSSFMKAVGLTNAEVTNLSNHLAKLDLTQLTPQLKAIGNQLNTLNFNSMSELSAQDQATLTNAFQQVMQLAQINPIIYLQKGNQKQQISINGLLNLQDLNGATFLIDLYDLNGQKLADLAIDPMSLSSAFLDSASSLMNYLQMLINQTLNGGQLPNTATHTWGLLAVGVLLLLIGAAIFKWNFKKWSLG